jgi:hypothetical protein
VPVMAWLLGITILYIFTVERVKKVFYSRYRP